MIILNFNGMNWLDRCLDSLQKQTIFAESEIIIADNASSDGSDAYAEKRMNALSNGKFRQNGGNLGFCQGNNEGAKLGSGRYLFFLNNDTWLEADCLEKLVTEMNATGAGAGGALVLDYDSDAFQSIGGTGFDWMGFPDAAPQLSKTAELFATCGCAYIIERDLFNRIGGFDREFFLYSDETDLSWRVWIAGRRVVGIPSARVHHRGAVAANPEGGTRIVETRTTAAKRYYANRNSILFLLKNAQHLLLILLVPHLLYLLLEAAAALVLTRQMRFVRRAYVAAVIDAWKMRGHVLSQRAEIGSYRKLSDFNMLPFLRLKPSRWEEIAKLFRKGVPKVSVL